LTGQKLYCYNNLYVFEILMLRHNTSVF